MKIFGVSYGLGFRGGEFFGFFRVNVWRGEMEGILETKVVPQESPLPDEVAGGQVVVVVGLGVVVIVVVVSFHPNVRLLPEESGQTGRRA